MERLPPTQYSLLQHAKQTAYQAGIWYMMKHESNMHAAMYINMHEYIIHVYSNFHMHVCNIHV